jgi:hypothetical protein
LKQGHSIQQPAYDFRQRIRAADPKHPFIAIGTVEGSIALHWPELRDQLT